ncbi:MAG: 1,4-alpha-glucan branching protein GlgB [Lachnospiraceae bacterium]|nr:1,4-alpha-glucan branching protein GlgB [Lachnospiraceae bacterium]
MNNVKETGIITEVDRYLFGEGTHYEIYKKLGAHVMELNGVKGVYFAVWAPKAKNVSVVGNFNGWMGYNHNMNKLADSGIFELFVPELSEGELYKFAVTSMNGETWLKADPFANASEFRPASASIVTNIEGYDWEDTEWMEQRKEEDNKKKPMAIYEVHLGSWKKTNDEKRCGFYNYRAIAEELGAYVKEMGYTHVELMGIAEHPFDGSWGYQVTGYYSPTSRYGTAKDFMYFVDYMHKLGIGVILDWVPAHFPRDEYGLANFDGSCVYEYADSRKGEHPDWGTKIFDYAKNEVSDFLIANALFWVNEFHVDGLRVDAVASMLYLDYGKTPGNWVPNKYGGHENLEAIEFFKHLNSIMEQRAKGAIMIAEESTAWPLVTHEPEEGGLGFTYKWNMGWMNDFLEYVKIDPYFKKYNHQKMTFGMTYAFSENFILVISHDEVVHLKCSMLEKMPGTFEQKFENLKTAYSFMFGHPGKKLLFMGQEFGQIREWSEERSLDWYLLEEKPHQNLHQYVKELLHLYTEHPAMSELDDSWEGFEWINCEDGERSTFSFIRKDKSEKKCLLFIMNFTPVLWEDYTVGVPELGTYQVILDSTWEDFKNPKKKVYTAEKEECNNRKYSLSLDLQPLSAIVMEFSMSKKEENISKKKKNIEKNEKKK